ncbi:MAG TPA: DUF2167 domain-containing protein [Polyangiaceae bacterium]|nr:DUF2167 domain-containing protein [Polyangiaceae bacterium]
MIDGREWMRRAALAAALTTAGLAPATAFARDAQEASSASPSAPGDSAEAADPAGASAAPANPWQHGPAHIELGHDLGLDLPAGFMFLPPEAAVKVLEQMGNFHNEGVLGLATSTDENDDYAVVIHYDDEGYVKDDETIDAAELLSSMREGLEGANEERADRGFKPLAIDGWAEPPHYDRNRHQLVWALIVSDPDGKSMNYNTRVLGRRGYASLNLVTDPAQLEAYKPDAAQLLENTKFATGARYEDFDASSDKTAEYGLAGLIAAGAGLGAGKLVKLGLLAKFWKVILLGLAAGKKVIVLALVGAGAYIKKLLGGRNKGEAAS